MRAMIALMKAVDHAQDTDVVADDGLVFDYRVLKSVDDLAYVPVRITLEPMVDLKGATAMYVRAVSRHDGMRSAQEQSSLRSPCASVESKTRDPFLFSRVKTSSAMVLRQTVTVADLKRSVAFTVGSGVR